jgi:protein SCO1/2
MCLRIFMLTLLAVLAALLAACGSDKPPEPTATPLPGTVLNPPRPLEDFTLTDHTGAPFSLSDLRGRPALVFFGFTNCPDICPTTLGEFKRVKSLLGRDADEVTFVFVSVDPQRDTPERLAEYVGAFDPAFIGLTGDDAALRPIAQEFGVYYQAVPLEGSETAYTVDHTASSFALDREGRLAIVFSYGTPPDAIVQRIRALL